MARQFVVLCLAWAMAGAALAQTAVPPLPAGANPRPVSFARMGAVVREGQRVGTYWTGTVCIVDTPLYWGDVAKGFEGIKDMFAEELKAAGFRPDVDPGNLFAEAGSSGGDLQVGAMVKAVDISVCENVVNTKGKAAFDIDWQVYSTLRREVVATIPTSVSVQQKISSKAERNITQEAFVQSVRALLANEQFRKLVLSADPSTTPGKVADAQIQLKAPAARAVRIADATGSVVAVFAGSGMGSGVLVSDDGYFVTAQHVVGDAKTVKIRWSDGMESTAEVVRSDKRRDVALLKAEPRGRTPLRVERARLDPGAQVYAIGTPLDPTLQNTVTRGVISGQRMLNGFTFIQSDVAVTHGNSGGPLLNDKGAVVGLAELVFRPEGENESLNFFVPAGDVLDFLQLKAAP